MKALAVGLIFALIGGAGWILRGSRDAARREAEQAASNVLLSLA
jgi:hypothetical protein